MKNVIALALIFIFSLHLTLRSQDMKLGKISKKDFKETFYEKDSSANAVVLFKKRNTHYTYDSSIGWSLITDVHERIRLFNKDGFDNATKKVGIYVGDEDEKFSLKAYTYNLENGKISKTKLDKKDIFQEEISENWKSKNFTMPNLKEGSIVEWKYTIRSPYTWSINDVICQYSIPIKYLKCQVQIPEFFEFNMYPSRYYQVKVKKSRANNNYTETQKTRTSTGYTVSQKTESNNVTVQENRYEINANDIPALKKEPYVSNINNYRAKITFEISAYKPTNGTIKYYNTTWDDVTRTIYKSAHFGQELKKSSHFKDDLATVITGLASSDEKLAAIFNFVKGKIAWNERNSKYTSVDGIKKAYKEGVGNSADINLTLVAMLREAGIKANPVLISTRSHGIPLFATKDGFNTVIAAVEMNKNIILMDATDKFSTPNNLPRRDLNWEGRVVRENGSSTVVSLYPKNYNIKKVKLQVKLDNEGGIEGYMNTTYVGLNALEYRNEYGSISEEDIISSIETTNQDIEINKFRLTNKLNISKPVSEMLQFSKDDQADVIGDKIYISPLLFLTVNENPFKLEERLYPIDYGSPWKNDTNVSLEIPQGYKVESIPESLSLTLPENMGSYLLKTQVSDNTIQIVSQTKLNVPVIVPMHYQMVKELYKRAIENQLEKIVLIQQGP